LYQLDQTKLTIGINNIFNTDPPRSNDNFPRFIYDPTGRFVYASVTKDFW
jgi:outer membrane receptor protein involved in Fe transport